MHEEHVVTGSAMSELSHPSPDCEPRSVGMLLLWRRRAVTGGLLCVCSPGRGPEGPADCLTSWTSGRSDVLRPVPPSAVAGVCVYVADG